MSAAAFSSREVGWSIATAAVIQTGFVFVISAIASGDSLVSKDVHAEKETPVSVTPVLDEIDLAKLGSKKVKYKLPDMWRKPTPVKRYEAKSAPTPMAEKTPEAIPSSEPVKDDPKEEPTPEDVEEVVKEAPELPEDAKELKEEPNLPEEGFTDGYEEGKQTDALKAMWVSRYRITLQNWLKSGFNVNGLNCDEAAGKAAVGSVQVSASGTVSGFSLNPSGYAELDQRANAALQSKVGQSLPPPPENLDSAEFFGTSHAVQFKHRCK